MALLEVIAFNFESAVLAAGAGAHRIELCSNAAMGGTTPSYGLIKKCIEEIPTSCFPMIRPRGGDFRYSQADKSIMASDILICKELGCKGVVFGLLNEQNQIDLETMHHFMALAGEMEVSFHRAFDRVIEPLKAVEQIIALGCKRILSSGQQSTAAEGMHLLQACIGVAENRITIMPGSGIRSHNIASIVEQSGAKEVHSSALQKFDDQEMVDELEIEKMIVELERFQ